MKKILLILFLLTVQVFAQVPGFRMLIGTVALNVDSLIGGIYTQGSTVTDSAMLFNNGSRAVQITGLTPSSNNITLTATDEEMIDSLQNREFPDTTTVGDWLDSNMVLIAENDSTMSMQDTNGTGYAYLLLTGLEKNQVYDIAFDHAKVSGNDGVINITLAGKTGVTDSISTGQRDTITIVSAVGEDDNYYEFDGVDDYASIADDNSLDFGTGDFSIEWYGNLYDSPATATYIFAKYASSVGYYWEQQPNSNHIYTVIRGSGEANYIAQYRDIFTDGELCHFVWTRGTTQKLYKNGVLQTPYATSGSINSNTITNTGSLYLGSLTGSADFNESKSRRIRQYTSELTQTEVTTLKNGGTVTGAVLDLQPKNITAPTWIDTSGNGNDGTVSGATYKQTELVLSLSEANSIVNIDSVSVSKKANEVLINPGGSHPVHYSINTDVVGDFPNEGIEITSTAPTVTSNIDFEVVGGTGIIALQDTIDFGTVSTLTTAYVYWYNESSSTFSDLSYGAMSSPYDRTTYIGSASPDDTISVQYSFDPIVDGVQYANAIIHWDGAAESDTVVLKGTGALSIATPTSLIATNNASTGIGVAWVDNTTHSSIEQINNDFNNSTDIDEWGGSYNCDKTSTNNRIRLQNNTGSTAWFSINRTIPVSRTETTQIDIDAFIGDANSVWLYVISDDGLIEYANYISYADTSYSLEIVNPQTDSLKLYLQGYADIGEYVEFDDFTDYETEPSWDITEIWRQDYLNDLPDIWMLKDSVLTDTSYTDITVGTNEQKNYKVRHKKDGNYSAYSNADTAIYSIDVAASGIVSDIVAGTYDYVVVPMLTSSIVGADIYYTLDGTTPTISSTEFYQPIVIENTTTSQIVKTLKAIATDGTNTSDVLTIAYTINGKYDTLAITTGETYAEAIGSSFNSGNGIGIHDFVTAGRYAYVPEQLREDSDPYIEITFEPDVSNTFYFWARVSGLTTNSYGELQISEDGGAYSTEEWWGIVNADSNDYRGWDFHWTYMNSEALTSGSVYSYRILNYEGTWEHTLGVLVDRVIITTNAGFIPPDYNIISPNGGEIWETSTSREIVWEYNGTSTNVLIEYTDADSSIWNTIIASTANDGSYNWTTPSIESDYRIRITDVDDGNWYESTNDFTVNDNVNPYSAALTFEKDYSVDVSSSATEAQILTEGNRQSAIALNAGFTMIGTNFNGDNANIPDTAEVNVFRTNNNNATKILMYNNLQTIHSKLYGEGVALRMEGEKNFQMQYYPKTTPADSAWYTRIESGPPGRYGVYFLDDRYTSELFNNIKAFYDGGLDAFYWDSFQPDSRFTYENDNWNYDGSEVYLLNRETNAPITHAEHLDAYREVIYKIAKWSDAEFGIGNSSQWANADKLSRIMNNAYALDGLVFESHFGRSTAAVLSSTFYSRNLWEREVKSVLVARRENLEVLLMTDTETDYQTDAEGRFYDFCSMLMGYVSPTDKVYLHTLDNTVPFEDVVALQLQKKRFVPLGAYTEVSNRLYKREFQHATIYINNNTTDKTVNFSASYYMEEDGTWSGSTATSRTVGSIEALIISTENGTIE